MLDEPANNPWGIIKENIDTFNLMLSMPGMQNLIYWYSLRLKPMSSIRIIVFASSGHCFNLEPISEEHINNFRPKSHCANELSKRKVVVKSRKAKLGMMKAELFPNAWRRQSRRSVNWRDQCDTMVKRCCD